MGIQTYITSLNNPFGWSAPKLSNLIAHRKMVRRHTHTHATKKEDEPAIPSKSNSNERKCERARIKENAF